MNYNSIMFLFFTNVTNLQIISADFDHHVHPYMDVHDCTRIVNAAQWQL